MNLLEFFTELSRNESRVTVSGNCITTPAWVLYVTKDGARLFPPGDWICKLVKLVQNGTISHTSAQIVCETWYQETVERISAGINKLIALNV